MYRQNLFDEATYVAILERLNKLTPSSRPGWGKMAVGQMLAHCAEVQDVYNGKPLRAPVWMKLFRPMLRPMLLADKDFSRNAPTLDQFRMEDPEDFAAQRERLVNSLRTMHALGRRPMNHPMLGMLTSDDVGWIAWKHLDHHLRQFGV
ncbi:MAG: DUF1569 domain-containing protein [Bacteroidetes bacterium]|nr:DUF1569 domain-containing protein [Bacteroidota bacterium]MDA0874583.1 DUF1569 domain-containing protein [Bacteroidota bacterium]